MLAAPEGDVSGGTRVVYVCALGEDEGVAVLTLVMELDCESVVV